MYSISHAIHLEYMKGRKPYNGRKRYHIGGSTSRKVRAVIVIGGYSSEYPYYFL